MDEDALPTFEEFVAVELPRLLGFARALCGNDLHDAWDLVQEGLARVGRRWSKIDVDGNPSAYARTVLVRLNIDRLRRLRREFPSRAVPDQPHSDALPNGAAPWLVVAIQSLTPRQRTAIVLRYVDDMDIASIARAMECSASSAKSHLSRARDRLREQAPTRNSEGSESHE